MSYSFAVRAATKAEAVAKIEQELDKVVASQPMHKHDRDQALSAAAAFLEIVDMADDRDLLVSINGSVGWSGEGEAQKITGSGVGVSVHLAAREAAAA